MKNVYRIKEDISFIKEAQELTDEMVAKKTKVSVRTIVNIISEKVCPTYDTLEKVYSYIYETGFRLNKTKEEILREIAKNRLFFHGSKYGIDRIEPLGSRKSCDFGPGFYLGESYSQAVSFVYDTMGSSVYAFEGSIEGLRIEEFGFDLDWMLLICYYRGMLDSYVENEKLANLFKRVENADLIIAPIADNKMFYIMKRFGAGEITDNVALHSLAASNLGMQYVFKTQKAIDRLALKEQFFISKLERKEVSTLMDERAKEIETKLKMASREFRQEGKFVDELFV